MKGEVKSAEGEPCDISYIALRNPSWANAWNTIYHSRCILGDLGKADYTPVTKIVWQGVDSVMPAGTQIKIWGLKA